MTPRALLVVVSLVLALALAACGDDDDGGDGNGASPAPEATAPPDAPAEEAPVDAADAERSVKVEIADFAYQPDPVTVQAGGKVIWINRDSAPHTATAEDDSFDTGTLDEGKLKSESFKDVGSYAYICTLHPQMRGTVEVVE